MYIIWSVLYHEYWIKLILYNMNGDMKILWFQIHLITHFILFTMFKYKWFSCINLLLESESITEKTIFLSYDIIFVVQTVTIRVWHKCYLILIAYYFSYSAAAQLVYLRLWRHNSILWTVVHRRIDSLPFWCIYVMYI